MTSSPASQSPVGKLRRLRGAAARQGSRRVISRSGLWRWSSVGDRTVPRPSVPHVRLRPMSTAVVTGGAGFLGSHLCEYLLDRDWRVICLDNLDTGSLENIERLRGDAFDFRYHNCVEFIDVAEPVDVVFHLASPASPVDYLRLPLATLKVGSYGTHNALGLAKFKRARFLIASSSDVSAATE